MDLIIFENLVKEYLTSKSEYIFIEILNALRGYMISVAINTRLKHYEYEDIIQELEFIVFKSINHYKLNSNRAWGYLTTCIKNKMYELYTLDIKMSNLENKIIDNIDINNSSSNFKTNIINEYKTNDLTDIEERILNLYYIDRYSISEIAELFNKSVSYITKKKRNAIKKITRNEF